jgi:hypothetical protein
VHGRHVVVAESNAPQEAGLEVLGEHVETGSQAEDDIASVGVLEVDTDGPLVEVVAQERGAHPPAVGVVHRRQ